MAVDSQTLWKCTLQSPLWHVSFSLSHAGVVLLSQRTVVLPGASGCREFCWALISRDVAVCSQMSWIKAWRLPCCTCLHCDPFWKEILSPNWPFICSMPLVWCQNNPLGLLWLHVKGHCPKVCKTASENNQVSTRLWCSSQLCLFLFLF